MPAAITSAGAVTGHGFGVDALERGLLSGRTSIARLTRFDPRDLCSELASQAPDDEAVLAAAAPLGVAPAADRASRLLLAAAAEALHGRDRRPSSRRAVLVGTTKGALEHAIAAWERGGAAEVDPLLAPTVALARAAGARGPARTIGAACASSTVALGEALALLEAGTCDEVVVGGCEGLHPFVYQGFHSLKALSPRPAAPFDAQRTGLSLGEAAVVLVLERLEAAKAAGRRPLAVVEGFGAASDGHDQTAPDPAGKGLVRACRQALERAGVGPDDIGRYHAHGTATAHNDRMEAAALGALFGERRVPVVGAKGTFGHTLGAAGALDALCAALGLARETLPPIANLAQVDPTLPVDAVYGQARPSADERALMATAGFGGINAALVLRRGTR